MLGRRILVVKSKKHGIPRLVDVCESEARRSAAQFVAGERHILAGQLHLQTGLELPGATSLTPKTSHHCKAAATRHNISTTRITFNTQGASTHLTLNIQDA